MLQRPERPTADRWFRYQYHHFALDERRSREQHYDVSDSPCHHQSKVVIINREIKTLENRFSMILLSCTFRELYPKVEPDQKIGKFRTVSTSYDYSSSNEDETDIRLSICEDSGSSKDSSFELREPIRRKRTTHHVEIKWVWKAHFIPFSMRN